MLQESARQGVQRQVLTPHFYQHKETSVADFLQKRQLAYEKIAHQTDMPELRLGAEVAWELGISECEGIECLAIEGTQLILLEPSYYRFHRVMLQDVYHLKNDIISCRCWRIFTGMRGSIRKNSCHSCYRLM